MYRIKVSSFVSACSRVSLMIGLIFFVVSIHFVEILCYLYLVGRQSCALLDTYFSRDETVYFRFQCQLNGLNCFLSRPLPTPIFTYNFCIRFTFPIPTKYVSCKIIPRDEFSVFSWNNYSLYPEFPPSEYYLKYMMNTHLY